MGSLVVRLHQATALTFPATFYKAPGKLNAISIVSVSATLRDFELRVVLQKSVNKMKPLWFPKPNRTEELFDITASSFL